MSSLDETASIERERFFDGQRLFADDLQRLESFNREMRWLHNQSLHQPGIGNGYAVTGRKGDRQVTVLAGYAVDDLGREIVLTGSRTIAVQPVAGDGTGQPQRYVLTVQYPGDDDLDEVELRQGICGTSGAVRLREEPIFCWVPLNPDGSPANNQADILRGRELVLAEVAVLACKLDRDISIAQRRNARPATQPYIACGVQAPTAWSDWNPWEDPDVDLGGVELSRLLAAYQVAGGLQATIDTRAAGFATVPGYFARIDGRRVFDLKHDGEASVLVLDGQLVIVEPTPTGFGVRVIVLRFLANHPRPNPEPAVGLPGRVAGSGFDVSALMLGAFAPLPQPGAALGDPQASAAGPEAAAGPSELVKLVADAWQVGWMGVEG